MLELIGLRRTFGEIVALDDVSFTVGQGRIVGFVGPNGAGKTTAMRITLGVLPPDAGQVWWRGEPVDAERRRRFGYMPEERGLYLKMRVLVVGASKSRPRTGTTTRRQGPRCATVASMPCFRRTACSWR